MKSEQSVLSLAAAGMLSVQAYASETQVEAVLQPAQTVAAFTDADFNALFEASDQPMQLAALSGQEMRETEGARGLWGALGGGIIGGIANVGYQLGAGRGWSWGSFGYAVGMGALTGFSGGPAAWYVVPRVAYFGGIGAGRMSW